MSIRCKRRDTVKAIMSRRVYGGLLVALAILVTTFFSYKTPAPAVVPPANVEFGGVSLRIDYALSEAAREKGLGGRTNIPDDYGMLFVFPKDGRYGFWMKDMLVPLDIFWLDAQGHVVSIVRDAATSTYPDVFYPSTPARYVLETAAGFARARTIATGTPLQLKNIPAVSE